jgi:DNA replication protein DnaC
MSAQELSHDDREARKELADAGFPSLHRERKELNGVKWKARFSTAWEYISNRRGAIVALVGPRGTGKTQMATELARRFIPIWIAKGFQRQARYCRVMDFFMAIKESYGEKGGTESDAFFPFIQPRLLVLDEVQVRNGTGWEDNALTYLLDRRYGEQRSTILISNLSVDSFVSSIGDSILSRMDESGAVIVCNWESFRQNHAEQGTPARKDT